jgi:hypothetical protein
MPDTALSVWSQIFPESPCGMLGFLDNFRQTFHKFQTRRGTFPWAVHCPIGVSASATGRRRRAGNIFCGFRRLLAATVRPWSKKVAVAWLYSSLGNQSETKQLFLESKLFPWIFSTKCFIFGFAVCFDIIVMPEHDGDCIV